MLCMGWPPSSSTGVWVRWRPVSEGGIVNGNWLGREFRRALRFGRGQGDASGEDHPSASLLIRRRLGSFRRLVVATDEVFFHEIKAGRDQEDRQEGGCKHSADDRCAEDLAADCA